MIDDDAFITLLIYEMIRSDSTEYLAQVQGEHMLLIMHCWHFLIQVEQVQGENMVAGLDAN